MKVAEKHSVELVMMLEWFVKVMFGPIIHIEPLQPILPPNIAVDTEAGNCSEGEVRLEDSIIDHVKATEEGRLEICLNNAWGTVCNSSFSTPDARVACNSLIGFHREGDGRTY